VLRQFDHGAHRGERLRDAAHGPATEARIAHEPSRDPGARDHTGEQTRARAAVAAVEIRRGLPKSPEADTADGDVLAERRHVDAKCAKHAGRGVHVGALEDRPDARRAFGERAADERAV
jgi:hypothetical protein